MAGYAGFFQLWKGDEAVLTAPLEYSDEIDIHSSPGKAFCCNLVRSNVPAIRVVLLGRCQLESSLICGSVLFNDMVALLQRTTSLVTLRCGR